MRRMMQAMAVMLAVQVAQAAEMPWAKDWESAQKAASATNKPIMVDFYTDWCGWCKKLDRDTYTHEKVVKLAADFVVVKLNAEKEGATLQQKYQRFVSGYPAILFLDKEGTVIGQIDGYAPPDPFAQQMTQIKKVHDDYVKAQATLKQSPADGEANAVVAYVHALGGKLAEAEGAVQKAEAAKFQGTALGRAYNGVGDLYQSRQEFDKALAYFIKTNVAGMDVEVRSYGLISIVSCHAAKQDLASAKKFAQELINLKGANPDHVDIARQVLQLP